MDYIAEALTDIFEISNFGHFAFELGFLRHVGLFYILSGSFYLLSRHAMSIIVAAVAIQSRLVFFFIGPVVDVIKLFLEEIWKI